MDDQFDDLINWRVGRASDEFSERAEGIINPATLKKLADDITLEMVADSEAFIGYFAQLTPEGGLGMINAWNEVDPATIRDAEESLIRSAILKGQYESSWEDQSDEVLAWLNSTYQNENLVGIDVPWIRTDLMKVWLEKINHGAPTGPNSMVPGVDGKNTYNYNATDIAKYRKFFTNVAQDVLPNTARSLNDPAGEFRRIDEAGWRSARGNLEMIPDFEAWKAMGSPERNEVQSLDWEQNERLRDHEEMRAIVDNYMDNFNEKFGVKSLSLFNADWPDYFRQHARERLEGEVLSTVSTPDDLQDALLKFNEYMYKEAEFYKYFMEAKLEVNQGDEVQNVSVAALSTLGFLGGGVGGAVLAGTFGGAAGGPGGAIAGGTGGGIIGAGVGATLGAAIGTGIDWLPIPEIGFQVGAPLHSRMRKEIDTVFKANFNQPGKSPETYFDELKAVIDEKAQEALEFDASTIDMGPISAQVDGAFTSGNIDR
jgi:hypothetical protein